MFCKYCGKPSGETDVCSECNYKLNNIDQNGGSAVDMIASDVPVNNVNTQYNSNMGQVGAMDISEKPQEYKGFWTLPRILSLAGALIFAFCCIMPQIIIDDIHGDVAIADMQPNGTYVFVIPFFIILNTILDKSMVTVTKGGFRLRNRMHKMCILFGAAGICTLFMVPISMKVDGTVVLGYTGWYYLSFAGCIMAIVSPFLVRPNDGTGIRPLKKYDYIWIAIVAVLTIIVAYGASLDRPMDAADNTVREQSVSNSYDNDSYAADSYGTDDSYYNDDEYSDEEILSYIEDFMSSYCSAMAEAINSGDYSIVAPYIESGSPLEASQMNLVDRLCQNGVLEEFVGVTINDVAYDEDSNTVYFKVTETQTVYYPGEEGQTNSYNYIYTVVGNDDELWLYDIESY